MFNILKKIIETGVVTRKDTFGKSPKKHRGKILVREGRCDSCNVCVEVCPADAISNVQRMDDAELSFDYSKCMYCGLCVDVCPTNALVQSSEVKNSVLQRTELVETFIIER